MRCCFNLLDHNTKYILFSKRTDESSSPITLQFIKKHMTNGGDLFKL